MMQTANSVAYTDLQGLAVLRGEARQNPNGSLKEVASQFESLFVQMMLKSMRDATIDGGLFQSNQLDLYRQMHDQQIAMDMSKAGGIGLADMLEGQMSAGASQPVNTKGETYNVDSIARMVSIARQEQITAASLSMAPTQSVTPAQRATTETINAPATWEPQTPDEFIRDVMPYAEKAAQRLGVNPEVLVAQSALETGWGKKVITSSNGQNSYNLFGIKAKSDWQGETASVRTVEYRDGVAAIERAVFKVYDSINSAFDDYVGLLTGSPRYQRAVGHAGDSELFVRELQQAGYATDPYYADKIIGILGRMDNLAPGLKDLTK